MSGDILDFFLLIPYYNNLRGLHRSLQSIVYDPRRYGLLIVDDGSDKPLCITDIRKDLPRGVFIHLIRLPRNAGITEALNTGLEWLWNRNDYRFVARLDCGDVCSPDRFVRQTETLVQNPDIDLLGSWVIFKNYSTGHSFRYETPVQQRDIERGMHFRNLFIHPAVMWRASVLQKVSRYPSDLPYAEDYGFFYEILLHGKTAILPEALVTCELNPTGLSVLFRKQQLKSRIRTVMRYRKSLLLGLIGAIKLQIMLLIPYKLIMLIKFRNPATRLVMREPINYLCE